MGRTRDLKWDSQNHSRRNSTRCHVRGIVAHLDVALEVGDRSMLHPKGQSLLSIDNVELQHVSKHLLRRSLPFPWSYKTFLFHRTKIIYPPLGCFIHPRIEELEVETQRKSEASDSKHGPRTCLHSARVIWSLNLGIKSSADKRAALSNKLHQGKSTTLSALTGLVVDSPGNNHGDDVEKADSSRINSQIAQPLW